MVLVESRVVHGTSRTRCHRTCSLVGTSPRCRTIPRRGAIVTRPPNSPGPLDGGTSSPPRGGGPWLPGCVLDRRQAAPRPPTPIESPMPGPCPLAPTRREEQTRLDIVRSSGASRWTVAEVGEVVHARPSSPMAFNADDARYAQDRRVLIGAASGEPVPPGSPHFGIVSVDDPHELTRARTLARTVGFGPVLTTTRRYARRTRSRCPTGATARSEESLTYVSSPWTQRPGAHGTVHTHAKTPRRVPTTPHNPLPLRAARTRVPERRARRDQRRMRWTTRPVHHTRARRRRPVTGGSER